ncbi:DUF5053 domain-containing protein [Bergeyella zoohelcum]|uniref:DUF5053 domain-containing protein n=2 Tax=Bergeyella zoohelcum TaxID=1015 RepID=K1LPC6_9FLAO|nr:DUF5053 domain-containing protein [Bergeyella zoohelcum]EKB56596.1 hypothetical protein HMPREF9699_01325 [Bergeyella zoohelcum ATCC 43767]MDY6026412.1 DUF5053 domain-containing protein [Bergeyella zoohelcum]SUV48496.1 Uncharacterised protein [Bergeyella zoohelcum]VDH05866.1 Uncharacterised protein [Bergeyella zoohelcum]
MIDKVRELKERFVNATNEQEKEAIDKEMQLLMNEDSEQWAEAMVETLKETRIHAEKIVIRQQLESVLPILPLSYIAENYFGKSKAWFYQRLNGNSVNGKPASFTEEEIKTLNFALQDLSQKLGSISVSL